MKTLVLVVGQFWAVSEKIAVIVSDERVNEGELDSFPTRDASTFLRQRASLCRARIASSKSWSLGSGSVDLDLSSDPFDIVLPN